MVATHITVWPWLLALLTSLMQLVALALAAGTGSANASARVLPAEPLAGPEYSAPAIQILPPPTATGRRKIKAQPAPSGSITTQNANTPLAPELGAAECTPDPLRPTSSVGPGAAGQIERLRQTASGKFTPDGQLLPPARQQRLQANAAWQMGLLTLHGICTVLNTADAAAWFERAQQLGEPLAPAGLAWCDIEGCKAAANPAAAGRWIELLRGVDKPRALYLQWLMQSRLAPLEITQPSLGRPGAASLAPQSRQLLASAAQQGDTNAKIEMGLDSVLSNALPEALAFFKSAAPRSAAAAINADVITERIKNAKRPPAASSPSRAAGAISVNQQSAADNLLQAQRYHRGQGVPANYTEAIRLYQLAQNQGNETARQMLALIFSRPAADGNIDLAWMQQLAQVDLSHAAPVIDAANAKLRLMREPTALFDLVPQKWRRYVPPAIGS